MSKHSFSYNINQRKYSLKYILYLFILFDIMLSYYIPFGVLWVVIGWELAVSLGLLIGLRGNARYRDLVYDLMAIRMDPKYKNKEELRGHRLIRHIDRAMIEYDLYLERQNKIYFKNKKKTKNLRGENSKMKSEMIKDLWYLLASIWAASGLMLIDGLWLLNLRPLWIIGIGFAFYAGDALFWLYLYHYQKIKKEDVIPAEIPKPMIIE